jgi:AraC-like DNA-binding protein
LRTGDLVVLSDGAEHTLQSDRYVHASSVGDYGGDVLVGRDGAGDASRVLCGAFYFDHSSSNPLLHSLPGVLHIAALDIVETPQMSAVLDLITHEAKQNRSAGTLTASWLMDTLFVYVVRYWQALAVSAEPQGLHALIDHQIGDALQRIHTNPSEAWSVEKLAKLVGMSRAAFAKRFAELVGTPPMEYITLWRIDRAAALLRDRQVSVAAAAEHVGYASEAAFGRRFQKLRGLPPAAYRAQHAARP